MSEIQITSTRNVTNSGEIDLIQSEIELVTKKIEQEKINLSLTKERYFKQFDYLMKLQGKPLIIKDKNKSKEKLPRVSVLKYKKKERSKSENKHEEIESEISKLNTLLEKIVADTNLLILDNKEIRKKIEDLRKEKLIFVTSINNLTQQKEILSKDLEEIEKINNINLKEEFGALKQKENDFKEVHEYSKSQSRAFFSSRGQLEDKFQELIEDNIRRERENKKELFSKKTLGNFKNADVLKNEEDEIIKDRTPILDQLIDKMKYINVEKKKLLDRYHKNFIIIKDSIEQMMEVLGIDDPSELPFVLEKMEDQKGSIEMLDSKLTDEIVLCEKEKLRIIEKIASLNKNNNQVLEEKKVFNVVQNHNIQFLQEKIDKIRKEISLKRNFFSQLKAPTDSFIEKMNKLYISDYVPSKICINHEEDYNESNINEIIGNVEDFAKFIYEIEKSSKTKTEDKQIFNKELDRLNYEITQKIDCLKKDALPSVFRNDAKNSVETFDDIIKNKAQEIIDKVNMLSEQISEKKKLKKI